jgi:hypothetical protein
VFVGKTHDENVTYLFCMHKYGGFSISSIFIIMKMVKAEDSR